MSTSTDKDSPHSKATANGKVNPSFDLSAFVAVAEEAIPKSTEKALTDFDYLRITKEKAIPHNPPTVTIAGAAFASRKNISGIAAAPKGGKTAFQNAIVSGALSESGEVEGFPDILVEANVSGKAVIGIDTEQSEEDQQYTVNTNLKRTGLPETPDHYRAYNARTLNFTEYQDFTNTICELCSKQFGGIHLIVIDGGADYIASVNDEATAKSIVEYFIHLSITYDCPVIVIVHQNPGSDKERGHFGSELQRKCYGLISITKEGDISTANPKIMRKAGNADTPLIRFKFCKEKGYHIQIDTEGNNDAKALKERLRLKEIAEKNFNALSRYTHTEACHLLMRVTNRQLSTAKTMIRNMEGFGYLIKAEDGLYRLG